MRRVGPKRRDEERAGEAPAATRADLAPNVNWKGAAGVVTSEKLADVGNSATVYSVLVEVE